jgi:hypothetical protein
VVYCGAAGDAAQYFQNMGFSLPNLRNLAVFLLDVCRARVVPVSGVSAPGDYVDGVSVSGVSGMAGVTGMAGIDRVQLRELERRFRDSAQYRAMFKRGGSGSGAGGAGGGGGGDGGGGEGGGWFWVGGYRGGYGGGIGGYGGGDEDKGVGEVEQSRYEQSRTYLRQLNVHLCVLVERSWVSKTREKSSLQVL